MAQKLIEAQTLEHSTRSGKQEPSKMKEVRSLNDPGRNCTLHVLAFSLEDSPISFARTISEFFLF